MRQMMLPSASFKSTKKKKDMTPALPPSNLSWSSPFPSSLVLTWTPGTDPNSAVLRHEYMVNGGPVQVADRPTGTTLSGLTRLTKYTVQVRAVSSGGPSPWVSVNAQTIYAYSLPGMPTALDYTDADMRPQTGIAWTTTVAQDGSGDYTDLKKAADDAYSANNNRAFNTRALIYVKPGKYVQSDVTLHEQTALVGTTGNRDDVIIQNATVVTDALGRGAIDTWGSTYVAHVTIRRVDTVNSADPSGTLELPKYAVHGTSGPCSIWVNCVFDVGQSTNNTGIPSMFGQDGGGGNYTLFYGCQFIGNRNDSNTNIHGGGTNPAPETVAYVNCTATNTHLIDSPANSPDAMTLGFKPLDDTRIGDTLWIVNCSGIVGTQMDGGAGGIVHKPAGLPMTNDSNPGTIDTRQDWPKPKDWKVSV